MRRYYKIIFLIIIILFLSLILSLSFFEPKIDIINKIILNKDLNF